MRIGWGILVVIVIVGVAACGKRDAPARAPEAAATPAAIIVDAAPPDAHEPPFARDPSADLRALGAALDALDVDAAKAWIDRAQAPRPADDPPFDEPMPDAL